MERAKSVLGADERDFRQFESKIDEVTIEFTRTRKQFGQVWKLTG